MFSKIKLALLVILLTGCNSNLQYKNENTKWNTSTLPGDLIWVHPTENDIDNIKNLMVLYKDNPYQNEYKKLSFNKLYKYKDNTKKVYVFDILYVDDVSIVYVLENDKVIENYILSGWEK